MKRLDRSGGAVEDLYQIWDHVADDNLTAADRLLARINAAELRLLDFPELGKVRDDLAPGLRLWPVGEYLILYRIDPDAVRIVRVLHGARDLPAILDD